MGGGLLFKDDSLTLRRLNSDKGLKPLVHKLRVRNVSDS
jgi:hypothetical protein